MRTKLTTMENRAVEYGRMIRRGVVTVVTVRRSAGGGCSVRDLAGRLVARAGGCGYDKEIAALTDALRWLGETEADRVAIWRCECVGQLTRVLARQGWILTDLRGPARHHAYAIRRSDN